MPIIFYDGVCGLCDRTVQFVLRHDRRARFRFAQLQSEFAVGKLGDDARDLDSVYVISDDGTRFEKSRAIFYILRELGFPWSIVALFRLLPRAITDWVYDRVAHNRYRWFGKYDQCRLPSADEKSRFVG